MNKNKTRVNRVLLCYNLYVGDTMKYLKWAFKDNIGHRDDQKIEIGKVITCDDDNIGSSKIIEFNGGILDNKIENEDCGEKFLTRRYWIKR